MPVEFNTTSPPEAPTNLCVITSTCHEIKIHWDSPVDNGADLVGKMYARPLRADRQMNF
jgi:hypothetical protein